MAKELFSIDVTVIDPDTTDFNSELCGDIMFYNDSAARIFVNGFPVDAQATYSIGANKDERLDMKFKINWAGQTTGNIYISCKRFL